MARRDSGRRRSTNWFAPIAVAVLMGAAAYAVSGRESPDTSMVTDDASADEGFATSTTRIRLGVRTPTVDRDRLFELLLPADELVALDVERGWRVEALHGRLPVSLRRDEERGTSLVGPDGWNVTLRAPTGEAYEETRIFGMFDARHAAVVAKTDRPWLLNVSRSGQIMPLVRVPDAANILGVSGGAAWLATFTPGEGIESEPAGPSALERIKPDGTREEVGVDEERVIVGVVSDGARHAYWHERGFVALSDGSSFSGRGKPLAWFPTGELLVADGVTLVTYHDGRPETLRSSLPGIASAAEFVE